MKHITWLSVLGLLVATLVPVSWQLTDEVGRNYWSMQKTAGNGVINKREDTKRGLPGKAPYRITTSIEDLPRVIDCTWDKDVMQPHLLSAVKKIETSCTVPQDLENRVYVKLLYDKTCMMFLAYDNGSCLLRVPKFEGRALFLHGESNEYPYLSGMVMEEPDSERNFLAMWKILLLYYGLFDYHGLAVEGHLSIRDKMSTTDLPGIDLSDLKDCPLEEQNEDQTQVLFLRQQCLSDPWVCQWTKEGYEERSSLQLTDPFDCGELGKVSWNNLPQQVELSFISTSTCSVAWRAGDAICHVSFPAGETMYAFVGGDLHFLGVSDIDPAGCRWETTFLHCHRAVNMDENVGKVLIDMTANRDTRLSGKKGQRIRAKIEDLPQELECTWDTDVMQPHLLSEAVRNQYWCDVPGDDLGYPVHVRLSYDGSCTMLLDYQSASCSLDVPEEKLWHAFLFGESHRYPYLISTLGQEKDECIWDQNLMHC